MVILALVSDDSLGPPSLNSQVSSGVWKALAPDKADIVTGHTFESSYNPIFGLGPLRPPIQFVLDCRLRVPRPCSVA
jgi:hypothetical protein